MILDTHTIYNRLKNSAKKRNIEFNLSLTDLNNITFPISCPILNIPLQFNTNTVKDNSYSFDRIDNNKGYSIDNICIISYKANKLKNTLNINDLDKLKEYFNDNINL